MKRPFRPAAPMAVLALLLAAAPVQAGSLRFDALADGVLLGGGMLLAGAGELLPAAFPPASPAAPQSFDVNAFDALFLTGHSAGLDKAGDACQYAMLAVPVLALFLGDLDDGVGALTVAVEAFSAAYGAKNLLKYAFPRWRPYFYTGGAPGADEGEAAESFPSGHATMAFAAAAVNTWLFADFYPDSPWLLPFAGVNYALAGTVAALRLAAGVHFATDVIVGALLGTAVGWGVPALRAALLEGRDGGRVALAASADGVRLRLRLD